MRNLVSSFAVALFSLVVLTGCSKNSNPLLPEGPVGVSSVGFLGKPGGGGGGANNLDITYGIVLTDVSYDGTNTMFTYSVTSNPDGGPAISHWDLVLDPECGEPVIVESSDPATEWSDPDPTTGVTGIKFDTGYDDQETRTVSFTLAGEWTVAIIGIAVKSGNGFVLGAVEGPHCEGSESIDYHINGTVFFDVNGNGVQDVDETGIEGITVKLSDGSQVVSDADGNYSFTVEPGTYTVTVESVDGLLHTTSNVVEVTIDSEDAIVDFGLALDWSYPEGLTADGFTIGYWKNNINKALTGKTRGTQVDAATLENYIALIGEFALSPFADITLQEASDVLSAKGSDELVLLAKQLLGSEMNYFSDAFIGGNEMFTRLFLYYGEYLIVHSSEYDRATILEAKDWYDAYNNTHGGALTLE